MPRSPTVPRPAAGRWTVLALLLASLFGLIPAATGAAAGSGGDDVVVVANRGSGDVSVIATGSLDVHDVDLPGEAEPMYVSHDPRHDRVLVGDRASSSVVALDEDAFEVVQHIGVGDGVFHQWLDPQREQLWVVGDTSRTVTVVDTRQLTTITTIDIPTDLVERGGVPHDVFVRGGLAFVSILGLDDGSGVVLQYSTRTFRETGRITTGGDPHLFVRGARLHIASQAGSTVSTYVASTLRPLASLDLPAAHGIYVTANGEVLVTNIAGGGTDALWSLNHRLDVRDVTDTAVAVPHNITVDRSGDVFVTHSGATADQVSVVDHDRDGFGPAQLVTVGTNPFGLAFVDR
jgi:DNA-binding beta-propeller fold protein YncE